MSNKPPVKQSLGKRPNNKPSYNGQIINNQTITSTNKPSYNKHTANSQPLIIKPEDIIWQEDINWYNKSIKSMLDAQSKINEIMLKKNFQVSQEIKDKLIKLQNDITDFYTSTCNVCGNKQSTITHMNIEHITMKTSWGYESMYDGSSHSLTLCDKCYDKHILDGPLGKHVKIVDYM